MLTCAMVVFSGIVVPSGVVVGYGVEVLLVVVVLERVVVVYAVVVLCVTIHDSQPSSAKKYTKHEAATTRFNIVTTQTP